MNYMYYVYKNAQKCTKYTIAMIHVCNLNRIQVMNYVYIATSVMTGLCMSWLQCTTILHGGFS